jgi:hypothetical protein
VSLVERLVASPRPVPGRLLPALAGSAVVVLALPIFLVAGWPVAGWVLAAVLWLAAQALGVLLARLPFGADSLAGSGVMGFGMMTRGVVVMLVLVAVAASRPSVALAAALLFALAYTLQLAVSILSYFGSPAR